MKVPVVFLMCECGSDVKLAFCNIIQAITAHFPSHVQITLNRLTFLGFGNNEHLGHQKAALRISRSNLLQPDTPKVCTNPNQSYHPFYR